MRVHESEADLPVAFGIKPQHARHPRDLESKRKKFMRRALARLPDYVNQQFFRVIAQGSHRVRLSTKTSAKCAGEFLASGQFAFIEDRSCDLKLADARAGSIQEF
jgi:hypothetical protein